MSKTINVVKVYQMGSLKEPFIFRNAYISHEEDIIRILRDAVSGIPNTTIINTLGIFPLNSFYAVVNEEEEKCTCTCHCHE
jgi:hypothetical protein